MKNAADLLGVRTGAVPDPKAWRAGGRGGEWPLRYLTQHGEVGLGVRQRRSRRGGEGKKEEERDEEEGGRGQGKRRNTLSRALIFAPLFSNNFKTSRFPPRLAQWMAVDSSYTRKVKGYN